MAGLYILDLDDTLGYTSRDLQGDPNRIPELKPVEGVIKFLQKHRRNCILLTAGKESEQQQKIDVLGIRKYFSEIVILPRPEEKPLLLTYLVQRYIEGPRRDKYYGYGLDTKQIVVIGDRPDIEIRTAHMLGCVTVRMRIPGGRHSDKGTNVPTDRTVFDVKDFTELMRLYPHL